MTSLKHVSNTVATLVVSIAMASQAALAGSPEIKLDGASGATASHPDLAVALADLTASLSVADASK